MFDAAGDCHGEGPDVCVCVPGFILMSFTLVTLLRTLWVSDPGWDNVSVDPTKCVFNFAAKPNGAVAFKTLRHHSGCDVSSSFHTQQKKTNRETTHRLICSNQICRLIIKRLLQVVSIK